MFAPEYLKNDLIFNFLVSLLYKLYENISLLDLGDFYLGDLNVRFWVMITQILLQSKPCLLFP